MGKLTIAVITSLNYAHFTQVYHHIWDDIIRIYDKTLITSTQIIRAPILTDLYGGANIDLIFGNNTSTSEFLQTVAFEQWCERGNWKNEDLEVSEFHSGYFDDWMFKSDIDMDDEGEFLPEFYDYWKSIQPWIFDGHENKWIYTRDGRKKHKKHLNSLYKSTLY